jgi:hypothetical protein
MVVKRPRRLNVLIDDKEWDALQRLANAERVTVSDYIRLSLWKEHEKRFGEGDPAPEKPRAPTAYPLFGQPLSAAQLAQLWLLPVAKVTEVLSTHDGKSVITELNRLRAADMKRASKKKPKTAKK